ncbi:MAG: peptidoglycan-binding domain-containing protein, partial [Candidatus Woesearchaeota archaeon]
LMGFRDEQLTGVYDEKTIAAVKYFQSKNINSGLKPDGIWGKKTRDVYLSNPQEEASSEVTLTMEGGVARVGTVNEGLSVDVAGPVALNYKGTEYELKNSVIDAQLGNDLSQTAALTLTTYNNDGEPVATVDRNGLQYVVHEGATPALTAVEQGFINGEFNLYDAVGAHVPLLREKGDNCAGYISTAISLFDGTNGLLSLSDYATYTGSPSASPISLSVAFGVFGNTWDFANNVVAAGGKVIFDKRVTLLTSEEREQLNVIDERIREINGPVYGSSLQRKHNAIMGDQVAYSNNNFLPGDVIVMYYGTTKSLNKAVAAGEDSTHSGVVFGNRVEYATYHAETQPTNLRDFVSETTGVNNPTLLSNYPIQVMSGDNQQWKKVKLASDGNYYFIEFVDKNTNVPIPGAQEVVLSEDTQVSVEKTYITDNVHGTMGTYDLNRYLNDNPHISLSEHLRPNEEVMAAVRDKQLDEEFDAVQVTADLYNAPNTYAAIIAQTGADETVAPLLLNRMTQEDKLRRSGILAKGDIILVPANPVNPATTEATGIERVSLWAQDVISEVEDVIS